MKSNYEIQKIKGLQLYTIRMLSIEACDEFKKRVKKNKKIVIWGDVNE